MGAIGLVVAAEREIELKLELRPEDAARIGRLTSLPHARIGLAKAEQIVTVYFDTPERALRREGLSLRLRHAGTRRIQTVKSESAHGGVAADRAEDEVPLNGVGPDITRIANEDLRARVLKVANKGELTPQFETVVLRTTRHIKTKRGDVIELVVDLGEVRAQSDECPISEIELELKSGSPEALFDVARTLNTTVPLRLVRLSKADRGFALIGDAIAAPEKSRKIALHAGDSAIDALRTILNNALSHLMINEPAVVERRDVEGLHQFRVALRRLRAIVATYKGLLDEELLKALEFEMRWISALCGSARDYDVFVEHGICAARAALDPILGAEDALLKAAKRGRDDAWAKVVEAVASSRFTGLIIELGSLAARDKIPLAYTAKRRHADAPAKDFAAEALDHHRKKSMKLGAQLSELSTEQRHILRKRLKRLRYASEFFASLFPEDKTKPYLKALSALQDSFGALNDVAAAERLIAAMSAFGVGRQHALVVEGGRALIAFHQARAEELIQEALERWSKFAKRKPFWREN